MRAWLGRPVPVSSLAVFRVAFGLLMAVNAVRFMASGWIETLFVSPEYFFKYPGFEWVFVPDPPGLYALYSLIAASALCIAIGLFYRLASISFLFSFAYAQLMDVTNYLNHYYLVVLVAAWLVVLPLGDFASVDAWRRGSSRRFVPAWMLYALRFQFGIVYLNAAVAKLGADWLLHGQPLNIWLSSLTETPLIGPWLDEPLVAIAMSWAGFLYDLSIVAWLSWRRTRPYAYAVVLVFHGLTSVFFDIGVFPFLMSIGTTLFFAPSWAWRASPPAPALPRLPRSAIAALGLVGALEILVPLRSLGYGGNVLWHEEGMRWSWRVMVREKNGSVAYRVRSADREWWVSPHEYLEWRQANEMSAQPDLILQLGRYIAGDFARRGYGRVSVHVDALASLNGRPPARLIRDDVDLAAITEIGPWILPAPDGPPIRLSPVARR